MWPDYDFYSKGRPGNICCLMGTMCCSKTLRQALERDASSQGHAPHSGVTEPPPMFSSHTNSAVFPWNLQGLISAIIL